MRRCRACADQGVSDGRLQEQRIRPEGTYSIQAFLVIASGGNDHLRQQMILPCLHQEPLACAVGEPASGNVMALRGVGT